MAVINREEEVEVVNFRQNWLFADCCFYLPLSTPTLLSKNAKTTSSERFKKKKKVSVSIWYLKMEQRYIGGNMAIISLFPQQRREKHSKLKKKWNHDSLKVEIYKPLDVKVMQPDSCWVEVNKTLQKRYQNEKYSWWKQLACFSSVCGFSCFLITREHNRG